MARMRCGVVGLIAVLAVTVAPAQEVRAPEDDPAVEAVASALEIETSLLEEALARHRAVSGQRSDALARVAQFYRAIDSELGRADDAVPERLDQLLEMAEQAERELEARLHVERAAVVRAREHLRRVALLARRLEQLKGQRREEPAGVLSGSWDIALMPIEQRGVCTLQQTGAVVSGTYRLEGGYNGSLQGTLVNRKVYLVRIDTKLGKIMELEGYLSSDGKQMRGTWLNYELAGAEGSTGQWTARRRSNEP